MIEADKKFIDDGGSVHPTSFIHSGGVGGSGGYTSRGLTVRDHFAGLAMQAIMSNFTLYETMTTEMIASEAYEQADAMIAARKG